MDPDLQFEWADTPYFLLPESELTDVTGSAVFAAEPREEDDAGPKPPNLLEELHDAHATIARFEADRHAARARIEELEHSCASLEERLAGSRRRLLILERQLEDAGVEPAREPVTRASWLDRIFGGLSSHANA
ncbi:MAG: hypothetical protein JOZ68_12615 [Acidimicrobiia bacterium]|nr:hypothetical protein [Acidimicrobiia bacterium]